MSYTLDQIPVVILAGGLGTRLRPLVADRPKCLAPVGDSVFLEIIIRLLKQQGLHRFILCVGYKGDMVRSYFGNGAQLGVEIVYSDEGEHLLGTAGAIRKAQPLIGERAIVMNGDTYLAISVTELLKRHEQLKVSSPLWLTVTLSLAAERSQSGNVQLDESQNRIMGFLEKGMLTDEQTDWVNAGVYVMDSEFISEIPQGAPSSLERDIIPAEISSGRYPGAYLAQAPFFDIGTPASLEAFRRYFAEKSKQ